MTALEYMREHPDDYKDFHFDCNGVYHNGDYSIKCFHSEAHGSQDFVKAFANSCNGAFSSLGLVFGSETVSIPQQRNYCLIIHYHCPVILIRKALLI